MTFWELVALIILVIFGLFTFIDRVCSCIEKCRYNSVLGDAYQKITKSKEE